MTTANKQINTTPRTHIKHGLPPVSGCGASVVMRDLYSDTAYLHRAKYQRGVA